MGITKLDNQDGEITGFTLQVSKCSPDGRVTSDTCCGDDKTKVVQSGHLLVQIGS